MSPKVSVIIPVYNGETVVSISLNSLLEQTYSNFEVIIIDDGSKDNTKEVVKKYLDEDIRFKYIFQPNSGVSVARNKGIKEARGEYICFLDSDDFYEKTYIERMLLEIYNKSADVCYCGYNVVTPRKKYKKRTRFKWGDILVDYILGKVAVHTTGWMIKKDILDKFNIRFQEGVSWGEDFEFFCEVLSRTKNVTYVKEYLTNYRVAFNDNCLSAFSMDKIDKDYSSIKRLQNNSIINNNEQVEKALIKYRLKALLIYRLMNAVQTGVNECIIQNYFNKYRYYIKGYSWNNGLRSIKLNYAKLKLENRLKDRR
ncbi:glycosyltransferase family 2 protein [Caldisalinibacter kiritimatiensis]|uniref:Beta-1,3-glucosyltransferase n=1 Tax=Caldisalinibacter kiritimatiensis TaxID=1304284 RepID=R1CN26_9FIRM|nr:glycosyltransferase family 2 protein [Caldisalinibacter kiritimatiensis]EOD00106.1 Beta-1,3-glucosyltransferase [Caldisalinibacter kiritimatiensis]